MQSRREKIAQDSFRGKVARETSANILQERRIAHLQSIQEKFRRHELRMMGDNLNTAVQGWVLVMISVQQTVRMLQTVMWRKVRSRQDLRVRAKRLVGLFFYAVRAVGNVLMRLKRCRRKNALKVTHTQVLGKLRLYVRIWVRRRRSKYIELISDFLSLTLYQKQQREIMDRWLRRMYLLRWFLLSLVAIRTAQVELIVLQWERYEAETLQDIRRRSGRRVTLTQRNALAEVPRYIKEIQAARLYRTLQFKFVKVWKTYCKDTGESEGEDGTPKPHFSVLLSYDDLVTLHRSALKTRHMWDTSLYHPGARKT